MILKVEPSHRIPHVVSRSIRLIDRCFQSRAAYSPIHSFTAVTEKQVARDYRTRFKICFGSAKGTQGDCKIVPICHGRAIASSYARKFLSIKRKRLNVGQRQPRKEIKAESVRAAGGSISIAVYH